MLLDLNREVCVPPYNQLWKNTLRNRGARRSGRAFQGRHQGAVPPSAERSLAGRRGAAGAPAARKLASSAAKLP
ncbi:Nucleolar Rna Helicase 2 [Manis pentadactyla]|nr:Nucleolar Rna Helicase 2 [Manis pentadactyla]